MNQASTQIARQFADGAVNKKNWGEIAYNVLTNGLIGDGVTDDTAALQALINKAIAEVRRTILFPHGQYYVTAITNADQVDFVGDNSTFVGGYTGIIGNLGGFAELKADLTQLAINVKSAPYNATGDGSTDDTTSIQAAIDSCELTGGQVYFPPGDYVLNSSRITVNGQKMTLRGDGARLLIRDGTGARPFVIQDSMNIIVTGLIFIDESTSGYKNGIDVQNSSKVTIRNCKFYDYNFYGVGIFENTDTDVNGVCDDILVEDCYFENIATYGIEHFPKVLSKNASFLNNIFVNCGFDNSSGFAAKLGQATLNTIVSGNKLIGCNNGFAFGNWESTLCVDNDILNCDKTGIAITASIHVLYTAGFQSLNIKDNLIHYSNGFVPTSLQYGAFSINGNKVDPGSIVIEGNTVRGWANPYVIRGSVAIKGIKMYRNFFIGCQVSSIADATVGSYPDAMELVGNYFMNSDDTKDMVIVVSGVNSVARDNTFVKYGAYSLGLYGDGIEASDNKFINSNPLNTSNRGPIFIGLAGTYKILDNYFDSPNETYLINGTLATSIIERGNKSIQKLPVFISGVSTATFGVGFISNAGKRTFYGTAAPTTSTHQVGDVVWNNAPAAGGFMGWICTTAGSPGTWKTFGPISA